MRILLEGMYDQDFEALYTQMRGISEMQQGMFIQQQQLYDAEVNRGNIVPSVNYPYFPPQQGPLPSHGHPYWQGPLEPGTEPRSYPDERGNYDYRAPGGCDYRGDPNYPYCSP